MECEGRYFFSLYFKRHVQIDCAGKSEKPLINLLLLFMIDITSAVRWNAHMVLICITMTESGHLFHTFIHFYLLFWDIAIDLIGPFDFVILLLDFLRNCRYQVLPIFRAVNYFYPFYSLYLHSTFSFGR